MFEKEITFDRVARWLIVTLVAVALVLLINRLSKVLLPFFIAWILAYMIYPFVVFLQNKCRLKYRVLSIVAALFVVIMAFVFLHEELTLKSVIGCLLIGAGTLFMVL